MADPGEADEFVINMAEDNDSGGKSKINNDRTGRDMVELTTLAMKQREQNSARTSKNEAGYWTDCNGYAHD
jgi:hypothetical protein